MKDGMILHQAGRFTVRAERFGKTDGYAVYEDGVTAARRVSSIGIPGAMGLARAIDDMNRRNAAAGEGRGL